MAAQAPLVWVDCEMTGLELGKDKILEIAALVTDGELNLLDQNGFCVAIRQPQSVLDTMNEWSREHHGKSGLTEKCLHSTVECAQADTQLREYIQQFVAQPKVGLLAGNSIHADRSFMQFEFPKVLDYLHYRVVDVSTMKELGKRWNPGVLQNVPSKKGTHRALDDIKESIEELRYYRRNWLTTPKKM